MLLSTQNPAVPTSVAAGAAVDCSHLGRKSITLESVGTATYQLQISNDPAASAGSFVNEGTALSAAGAIEVTKPCLWIRWNCTAYTSGTPVSRLTGEGLSNS